MPAIGLSLERGTDRVPKDRYYYVLLGEEIQGRFRTKNLALKMYHTFLQDSGYTPPAVQPGAGSRNEAVERYLEQLEEYWTESHRHTRRGGKSMYRR